MTFFIAAFATGLLVSLVVRAQSGAEAKAAAQQGFPATELNCAYDTLAPADRAALASTLDNQIRIRAAGGNVEPADEVPAQLEAAVSAAVQQCYEKFHWDQGHAKLADDYVADTVADREYTAALVGRGAKVEQIDRVWSNLTAADMLALDASSASPELVSHLVSGAKAVGLRLDTATLQLLAGVMKVRREKTTEEQAWVRPAG